MPALGKVGCDVVVIYGISALEYWLTPPQVKLMEIPGQLAAVKPPQGCGLPVGLLRQRKDAPEATRRIGGRLLGSLKGLSLPVHVMADDATGTVSTRLLHKARVRKGVKMDHLVSLGGGLFVTSIEQTLLDCACVLEPIPFLMRLFEACGTYNIPPSNPRTRLAVQHLVATHEITPEYPSGERARIYEFYDAQGRRVLPFAEEDEGIPWELCFSASRRPTWLWRRPPLTSQERLLAFLDSKQGARGAKRTRRLLGNVIDGSASPIESKALIMLCGSTWIGGEAWRKPWPNRRLEFPSDVQRLSGQSHAIPDVMWIGSRFIIECQGKAFHVDEQGFEVKTGKRSGLEAMGFEVREITDAQMRSLESWDVMVSGFAKTFGMPLRKRTQAFLTRREKLHRGLFGR